MFSLGIPFKSFIPAIEFFKAVSLRLSDRTPTTLFFLECFLVFLRQPEHLSLSQMRTMTIVNKPKSSKSKKASSRRSGKPKKPSTKKLMSRTANWGRIPPAEDSSQVCVAQGCGGAIYCRSSEKSKPFAQRDLSKCALYPASVFFKTKVENAVLTCCTDRERDYCE